MARVTLVTGQAQQGKTTLALAILKRECQRGLILDPVRSKPFNGIAAASSWEQLAKWLGSPEASGRWLVCLRSMEFEDYTQALYAAPCFRHVTLLVDEGLTFSTDTEAVEPLIKLCRMNAHFGNGIGVPVIITAQRPNDLPPDVRSQADRWFSFRQEEPRDLQYLGERCSPEFSDRVAGLSLHHWLTYPPVDGQPEREEEDDGQGLEGRGVRGGGGRGARRAAHDSPAQRGPETPRPDGRRLEPVNDAATPA